MRSLQDGARKQRTYVAQVFEKSLGGVQRQAFYRLLGYLKLVHWGHAVLVRSSGLRWLRRHTDHRIAFCRRPGGTDVPKLGNLLLNLWG